MSDVLYPVLPGQTWPRGKTIRTATTVRRASGRRFALSQQLYPTYLIRIPYSFLRKADLQTLAGFFRARRGALDDFLFDDRDDNTAAAQVFGITDGTTTAWQIVRTLGGFTEPVYALNGQPVISVDGVPAENLIAQVGGFDINGGGSGVAVGWSAYEAGSAGVVARDQAADGAGYVQRVFSTALAPTARAGVGGANFLASSGQTYSFSADVATGTGGVSITMEVNWVDSSFGFLGAESYAVTPADGAFQRMSFQAVAPANTYIGNVYIWMQGSGAAASLFIDKAQVQRGSVATAFSDVRMPAIGSTGIATFPDALAAGKTLTWSGKYLWRCAFTKDEQDFEEFLRELYSARQVEFETFHP